MRVKADIVIAGGAVMGSSIAYHLAVHPGFSGRIVVVEPDFTYARSASALSAGSIRQQFSDETNIAISLYGIEFLRHIGDHLAVGAERPAIGLHEGGYLYLAGEDQRAEFTQMNVLQTRLGAQITLEEKAALAARFPWLNVADIALGSLGLAGEGWFDGYGLMQAFRAKARVLGVEYVESRVETLEQAGGRIQAAILADGTRIACGVFINAAGASGARELCEKAGFSVPVYAKKRCVFPFTCKTPTPHHPLIIDPSGVWWRPEGAGYIAGYSPPDGDETDHRDDFEVDWPLFDEVIWPALAHRIPAFEAIRPGNAWAGHYDLNILDHNAMIGRLGSLENAYLACGFSGHGLQQAPAVGRGLAEFILEGAYRSLDLSPLGFDRLAHGTARRERNVI